MPVCGRGAARAGGELHMRRRQGAGGVRHSIRGNSGRPVPPAVAAAARAFVAEALEVRRMMAAINGTEGDDVIVITHDGITVSWTINGQGMFFPRVEGPFDVDGRGGNDHITLLKTTNHFTRVDMTGGSGRDTFVVGSGDLDANFPEDSSVLGPAVHILDATQEDSVIIDDTADTTSNTYNLDTLNPDFFIDARGVFKGSERYVQFGDLLGNFTLRANGGGNTINVNFDFDVNDPSVGANAAIDLTIEGNGGNDTVNFNTVVLGDTTRRGSPTRVIAAGGAGNDVFNVPYAIEGATLDLRGGANDDRFNFDLNNDPGGDHGLSVATVRLDGGDGTDRFLYDTVGPAADRAADVFDLTDDTLNTQFSSGFTYFNLEAIDLNSAGRDGLVRIQSTPAGVPVTFNAGDADTRIEVGGSDPDSLIRGPLVVNGQGGNDTVVIDQVSDLVNGEVYTLTSNKVQSTDFTELTFSSIQDVELLTGNQASTIFIDATSYDLTLNTRTGVDDVVITNLDLVNGRVDLVSPLLNDNLTIDGGVGTTNDTYTLTGNSFDATGFPLLTWVELNTLNLLGNAGANTFNINGDLADVLSLVIHGGGGNDTFNVAPLPSTPIDLDGDAPEVSPGDKLVLNPEGSTGLSFASGANSRAGTYSFTNRQPVQFESIELRQVLPFSPSVPNLLPADDTGSANTDNITADTSLTFVGTAEDGFTVTLRVGTTVIGAGTANASGDWTAAAVFTADGTYHVTATATNPATGLVSAASAALVVVIDRVAPAAPGSAPDLNANSDTGLSPTDNNTSDTTPEFIVVAAPAGQFFRLFRNGAQNGGAFRTGTTPLAANVAEGANVFTYSYVDAAGNVSPPSPGLTVTIDTTAPAPPTVAPDLSSVTDSGSSSSDDLTNVTFATFVGTNPAGTVVRLLVDGAAAGLDTLTAGGYAVTVGPLAEGVRSVVARHEDLAGNASAAGPALAVTIDVTPPVSPTEAPDLEDTSDSGTSLKDDLTNDNTPTFVGRTSPDFNTGLFANGIFVASGVFPSGVYSLTSVPLPDGNYNIQLLFADAAGNVSTAFGPALSVTIDTTAPAAPAAAPDLAAASDTGISPTDNITSQPRPTFSGPTPANQAVRLLADGAQVGIDTTTATGAYAITLASALADGTRTFTLTLTDPAGNVSAAGPGVAVTTDTVAPAAPTAAPDLLSLSDTGASDADDVTNDNTPTLVGPAPAGTIVRLLTGGGLIGPDADTADGLYVITTPALADGVTRFLARFEDVAGNASALGPQLAVTVDTAAPSVTEVFADGMAWAPAFRQFLAAGGSGDATFGFRAGAPGAPPARVLPWSNLNRLSVRTSEPLPVQPAHLNLSGRNVPSPAFAPNDFSYDAATATATFALASPLTNDRLTLGLAPGLADLAGNPLAPFSLPLNVLPGDVDGNAAVNIFDTLAVRNRQGTSTTVAGTAPNTYTAFHDVDGNGAVNIFDTLAVRNRQGTGLPAPAAVVALFAERRVSAERSDELADWLA